MKNVLILLALALAGCASTQPNNLPHRTTGLDPQGHLPWGESPHAAPCPGQYAYFGSDPGSPFLITCWGTR